MLSVTPFDSWVRSRTEASGRGKWHLVLDVRQLQVGAYQNQVSNPQLLSADRPFVTTPCGQAIGNPDLEQPTSLAQERWAYATIPTWIPNKGTVCVVCVEALIRHLHSNSVLKA